METNAISAENVRELLEAQGFSIPRPELEEVTARINAIIAGFLRLEYSDVQLEPWPHEGLLVR